TRVLSRMRARAPRSADLLWARSGQALLDALRWDQIGEYSRWSASAVSTIHDSPNYLDVSHTPKQMVCTGEIGRAPFSRLSRSAADADRLSGDLVAGGSTEEGDEVCDFFWLDHFTQRHASHCFFFEFFDTDAGRCSYVTHAGPSHLCVRP